MLNFTAIAIKTANENPNSLCSLNISTVRDNHIVTQKNWHFRPKELRVEPVQRYLYNLHPIDVIDAADFTSQWPEIKSYLNQQMLVCHQAVYTITNLCHLLDELNLEYPNCYFIDTMMLIKCAYSNLSSRKLEYVCTYMGIDSAFDKQYSYSEACAKIFIKLARTHHITECDRLSEHLMCTLGKINHNQIIFPYFEKQVQQSTCPVAQPILSLEETIKKDTLQNLNHQIVCFTGPLKTMTRSQAVKRLNQIGATYASSVTSKTNVLVTNVEKPENCPVESLTSKLRRALLFREGGYPINIIDEETFLTLIK